MLGEGWGEESLHNDGWTENAAHQSHICCPFLFGIDDSKNKHQTFGLCSVFFPVTLINRFFDFYDCKKVKYLL